MSETKPRELTTFRFYWQTGLDPTYKKEPNWKTQTVIDNFFQRFEVATWQGSYQRLDKPIKVPASLMSFNTCQLMQYVTFTQADDMDPQAHRTYYAFVTNVTYVNDGLTWVNFSLDCWTTYYFDWTATQCEIKRVHVKERASSTSFTDEFLSVVGQEEPVGGDGATRLVYNQPCAFDLTPAGDLLPDQRVQFITFVAQPDQAQKSKGSYIAAYSQYNYFVIAYDALTGLTYEIQNGGKTVTQSGGGHALSSVYEELSKDSHLIGTSPLTVDTAQFNFLGLRFTADPSSHVLNFTYTGNDHLSGAVEAEVEAAGPWLTQINLIKYEGFAPQTGYPAEARLGAETASLSNNIFEHLKNNFPLTVDDWEAFPWKIFCSPFCGISLTTGRGGQLNLDFAKWGNGVFAASFYRYSAITENGHQVYAVNDYNQDGTPSSLLVDHENAQLIDDAPRSLPLLADTYAMYLNANRNQLATVRANAKMNEILAKEGNQISYDNTQRTLGAQSAVMGYEQSRERGLKGFEIGEDAIRGGIKGGGALGDLDLPGMAIGAAGGAAEGALAYGKAVYNQNTQAHALAITQGAELANAAANRAYANQVATNNYEQTIRSQNAVLADMANHNSQIAHAGSNFLFDFENYNYSLYCQYYTSQPAVLNSVVLYFQLFGYAYNRYGDLSDYMERKNKFTYLQTSNCQLLGKMPTPAIETLQKMFDSGVQLWTPETLTEADDSFRKNDISHNHYIY